MMINGSRRICTVAAVALLAVLANAASALAGEAHPYLNISFGRNATQPFSKPNGIAIDEATGDVYVADIATDTVYKFDADGKPVAFASTGSNELTGSATPPGSFSFPQLPDTPAALAVDNSTSPSDPSRGDLYVMNADQGVIDKFSSSGQYVSQITGFEPATGSSGNELLGLAIDPTGDVHVHLNVGINKVAVDEFDDSSTNHLVAEQRNEAAGAIIHGVPATEPSVDGYAVGPTGDSFVLYGGSCSCAGKLGQQLPGLGELDGVGSGDLALATDPATGHVYIDGQSSVGEWDTGAMNGSKLLPFSSNLEPVGTLVSRFGSPQLSGGSGQGGIAVDGASGRIYVSNPVEGKGEVYVFGSDSPAVTAGAPTSVTEQTATLNGTVTSRGAQQVISCEFEYGVANEFGQLSGERYESKVPCEPASLSAGTGKVAVSADLRDLTAGLLYRFRLKATNANGSSEGAGLLATAGEGFGVKSFEVSFLNEDGTPDTQAGSHPHQLVNNIEFKSHYIRKESNADALYYRVPNGTLKRVTVDLPPGLVGDPNATLKKCTLFQFIASVEGGEGCPREALLGGFNATWSNNAAGGTFFNTQLEPVYNLMPARGVALQIGTKLAGNGVVINNGVLAGGDYPVQATVINPVPAAPVLNTRLTVSGVVGGEEEIRPGVTVSSPRKAFLTLPTGCHGPLRSTISVESYQQPGATVGTEEVTRNAAGTPVSLTGCSQLQFAPTISGAPDSNDASTSSGLTIDVHVPQTAAFNPDGLAESALRDTTVALPEGVAINPSGGDGLLACSEGLAGFTGLTEFNPQFESGDTTPTFTSTALEELQPGVSFCPDGSKIGTVKLKTPLLEHELEGAVYLATQNSNPFGSLLAMYMMIEDPTSGSTVKLTGEVHLTATGQVVTTFKNTPNLPFEDLALHFFGGERAPLATPSRCGTYKTKAVFTPWDGNAPVTTTSSFNIEHGPAGGPCPGSALPFSPSLAAGMVNNNAGAFSPLTTTIGREDGQQNMKQVTLHMPPGLSGVLSGVKLCPEAQANEGTCGPESLIGETTVSAGVGSDPVTVTGGKVYLTERYAGAPLGLSIVNPVKAGPIDLEHDTSNPAQKPACDCVVVRAKIEVDPHTAALTVTTDPPGSPHSIPSMIDGVPVQIRKVNVTINRAHFAFNPTSCDPMAVTGALFGEEGATQPRSAPFQATNCRNLVFAPKVSVATSGKTSKAAGASLTYKLTYPNVPQGSDADIRYVKVQLPLQLPSRLTTLQKACTQARFQANPAACPGPSVIGHAKAIVPNIPVPLEGPVYFVSNGGEAFPNLVMVLQGYGVRIDLIGDTLIKKGITSTTFKAIPDNPVSSFEISLPQGPYSALASNANFCAKTRTVTVKRKVTVKRHGRKVKVLRNVRQQVSNVMTLPNEFIAQNGAQLHKSFPIKVTGCPVTAAHKVHRAKRARKANGHIRRNGHAGPHGHARSDER